MNPETHRRTGSILFMVVVAGFLVALGLEGYWLRLPWVPSP
jgi:hypothetical protein